MKTWHRNFVVRGLLVVLLGFLAGCFGDSSTPATVDESQKKMQADMDNMTKMIPQQPEAQPSGAGPGGK